MYTETSLIQDDLVAICFNCETTKRPSPTSTRVQDKPASLKCLNISSCALLHLNFTKTSRKCYYGNTYLCSKLGCWWTSWYHPVLCSERLCFNYHNRLSCDAMEKSGELTTTIACCLFWKVPPDYCTRCFCGLWNMQKTNAVCKCYK